MIYFSFYNSSNKDEFLAGVNIDDIHYGRMDIVSQAINRLLSEMFKKGFNPAKYHFEVSRSHPNVSIEEQLKCEKCCGQGFYNSKDENGEPLHFECDHE